MKLKTPSISKIHSVKLQFRCTAKTSNESSTERWTLIKEDNSEEIYKSIYEFFDKISSEIKSDMYWESVYLFLKDAYFSATSSIQLEIKLWFEGGGTRGPPDLIVKSYEAATQCPREPADIAQYLKNLSEGKHIDWRAFGEQSRFACIRSQIEQEERHQWDKLIPVANRTIHRKPRL